MAAGNPLSPQDRAALCSCLSHLRVPLASSSHHLYRWPALMHMDLSATPDWCPLLTWQGALFHLSRSRIETLHRTNPRVSPVGSHRALASRKVWSSGCPIWAQPLNPYSPPWWGTHPPTLITSLATGTLWEGAGSLAEVSLRDDSSCFSMSANSVILSQKVYSWFAHESLLSNHHNDSPSPFPPSYSEMCF